MSRAETERRLNNNNDASHGAGIRLDKGWWRFAPLSELVWQQIIQRTSYTQLVLEFVSSHVCPCVGHCTSPA